MHQFVELTVDSGSSIGECAQTVRQLPHYIANHPVARNRFSYQGRQLLDLAVNRGEWQRRFLESEALDRFAKPRRDDAPFAAIDTRLPHQRRQSRFSGTGLPSVEAFEMRHLLHEQLSEVHARLPGEARASGSAPLRVRALPLIVSRAVAQLQLTTDNPDRLRQIFPKATPLRVMY